MSKFKVIDITRFVDPEMMEFTNGKCEVTIRKLTFGQLNKIQTAVTNVKVMGNVTTAQPDVGQLRNLMVLAGMEKCPNIIVDVKTVLIFNGKDVSFVEALPSQAGSFIYDEIEKFNAVDPN